MTESFFGKITRLCQAGTAEQNNVSYSRFSFFSAKDIVVYFGTFFYLSDCLLWAAEETRFFMGNTHLEHTGVFPVINEPHSCTICSAVLEGVAYL